MQAPKPIKNLLEQARRTSQVGSRRIVRLKANLITPTMHIPLIIPGAFSKYSNFVSSNSDDARIKGHLQPGAYFNSVLPYKDNLLIEVLEQEGISQTSTVYRCIPLGTGNPSMAGQHSATANLDALNNRNVIEVEFQLMDPGFDLLKNVPVDRIVLMGKLDDTLHSLLTEQGEKLGLTGPNAFRGVDIEKPIDNPQVFQHIVIPQGTRLVKLAEFLQNDDQYGIYSKGLGSYYRKGMWYIYTLYRLGRYRQAPKVLDIYRLPQDTIPTLEVSYYTNERGIIVLSTGEGDQFDRRDIRHQNKGTGTRVINPDALAGEAGNYYGKGQALTTRQDSLSEFRTSQRANDNDFVPMNTTPSSNVWKFMSENARNDGMTVTVDWHNSNISLISPGMPCRYYYMEGEVLRMKEGTVLETRMDFTPDRTDTNPVFRERGKLHLFLMDDDTATQ
ncbi:hypothetical protein AVA65_08135 [Salmonella enterica subsp. enterica serovar Minnesota]|nr:hypothetical protein [Salmonella enterica subsp. enterica serovar Minnesota]